MNRGKEEARGPSPLDLAADEYVRIARLAASNPPTSGHFLPDRSLSELRDDKARWHFEAAKAGVNLLMAVRVPGKPELSADQLSRVLGDRTMLTDEILKPLQTAQVIIKAAIYSMD